MLHYILLFGIALSLLACPSKPRRRPPVLPALHSGDGDRDTDPATTFTGAGLHLALQSDAAGVGYQPLVLRITERGVAVPVAVSKTYSSAEVFFS